MSDPEARRELVRRVRSAKRGVVLTGAGVSTDSGVPDFRSPNGLWSRADPMRYATAAGLLGDPVGFYAFWGGLVADMIGAQPNVTHRAVAALERRGGFRGVATQNVDGLHQRAGSRSVLEPHGTFLRLRCTHCGLMADTSSALDRVRGGVPRCIACDGLLRPHVVLFGESLMPDFEDATEWVREADVVLVLGTALEVAPFADLVPLAAERGAAVLIVNRDPTPHDDVATIALEAELKDVMSEFV